MNRIKELLTRKIGPLPAGVWLAAFAVAVYYYRRRVTKSTSPTSTTGQTVDSTGSGNPPITLGPGESVYDPSTGQLLGSNPAEQGPTVLDPGQSVFDPGTGGLLTTPQPPPGGDGSTPPPDQPIAPPEPVTQPPTPPPGTPPGTPPPPHNGPRISGGRAPAAGAMPAPYGPHKPHAPKGYHTVGTGAGNWWFVPNTNKRKKGKGNGKSRQPGNAAPGAGHGRGRPRGGAGVAGPGGHSGGGRGRRTGGAIAVPLVGYTGVPPGAHVGPDGTTLYTSGGKPIGGLVGGPRPTPPPAPGRARTNPGAQPGGTIQRQRPQPAHHTPARPPRHPAPQPHPPTRRRGR